MMQIVIAGCSSLGARLAAILSQEGHEVAVIDEDQGSLRLLGDGFPGSTVLGAAFDRETLIRAGIERADALVAVDKGGTTNMMAAETAKFGFRVPRVVALIDDPENRSLYRRMGIETIGDKSTGPEVIRAYLVDDLAASCH